MLFLRLAAVLLLAAGCTDHDIRLSHRDDDYNDNLWEGYLLGDTVQLYAREVTTEGDPTAVPSGQSPDLYRWSSRTPDVVEVIAPGKLVMKGVGRGEMTVAGPNARRNFIVWSYPADAQVRFGPRDTTLDIGDIVRITSVVLDGNGKMIHTDDQRHVGYAVGWGSNIYGMVLTVVNPSDARYWRAERSGYTTVMGGIALYKRFVLRDSIKITVR